MSFSPGDRELFEGLASQLYGEVAATDNGLDYDDPRLTGADRERAVELLIRVGLLVRSDDGRRWIAVDPTTAQSTVVAPMGQQGAELIAESAHWAQAFSALSLTWRKSAPIDRGPVQEVRGEAINPFIAALVADAETELLTAQPQAGRNRASLDAAATRDISALERGVRLRTLYQHSARRSTHTYGYVSAVSAKGAEVRTLDEFFNRLIVVDRKIAVIPGHEGLTTAVVVREPSLVAYLVDVFERHWERARPFTQREATVASDIAAEQRAMTIRMLIEGHADPASAKRLGVSPRTYAGYVADLKDEFEAETRFQLGYAMGVRGVDGHDGKVVRRESGRTDAP